MSDVTTKLAMEASDKAMEITRLKAENAKLREQASSLVGRSFRTADKMSCIEADNAKLRDGANAMRQLYEDELKHALAENAKLRELVSELWVSCPVHDSDCDECQHKGGRTGCELYDRMRELGVIE